MKRLCPVSVHSFRADGTVMDLAAPSAEEVDFTAIAARLSKIARFNGTPHGVAYSVAQHCCMGAEAILQETGDHKKAALFLLHDAHEYLIGDIATPARDLIAGVLNVNMTSSGNSFIGAVCAIKHAWDAAIYQAAGLPEPDAWTNSDRHTVERMDARMLRAEVTALFGNHAAKQLPYSKPPKTRGAITPWPAMKAEEAYFKLLCRLIGEDRARDHSAISAIAAATSVI